MAIPCYPRNIARSVGQIWDSCSAISGDEGRQPGHFLALGGPEGRFPQQTLGPDRPDYPGTRPQILARSDSISPSLRRMASRRAVKSFLSRS